MTDNVFHYQNHQLFAENVYLGDIAQKFGTPCYVYSKKAFVQNFKAYQDALAHCPHLICYAVKANSNIAVLNLLAELGSGFDIVSQGELERVLAAGGQPDKVVFSGVGKLKSEMVRALEVGIHCFNIESESELLVLQDVAQSMGKIAPISIRVNPDVDAKTHPYISTGLKENKFGIDIQDALRVYRLAESLSNIQITGVDCHIGSQLTTLPPYKDAFDRVLVLVDKLKSEGIEIKHIDMGGGLGVKYQEESPPSAHEMISIFKDELAARDLSLLLEPGRSIAANAGIFLMQTTYIKGNDVKQFAVTDGAMNDLIRPSLYNAWQAIKPVDLKTEEALSNSHTYDIVGPVCETGDFIGKDRQLSLSEGDLLAVFGAGAYGFTMSSNYNTRNRAVEIMVDNEQSHVIRKRETYEHQMAGETLLPKP